VFPRLPTRFAPHRRAIFALAASACLVLAACSPGADYPSLFPSVHDIPAPRADAPLDSNQVQQATEDLITARDRLTAEAQSAPGKSATGSSTAPAGKSAAKPAHKPAAKSAANSAGKTSGNSAAGVTENNQSAGAVTK
jgi:hypothetical protein